MRFPSFSVCYVISKECDYDQNVKTLIFFEIKRKRAAFALQSNMCWDFCVGYVDWVPQNFLTYSQRNLSTEKYNPNTSHYESCQLIQLQPKFKVWRFGAGSGSGFLDISGWISFLSRKIIKVGFNWKPQYGKGSIKH